MRGFAVSLAFILVVFLVWRSGVIESYLTQAFKGFSRHTGSPLLLVQQISIIECLSGPADEVSRSSPCRTSSA